MVLFNFFQELCKLKKKHHNDFFFQYSQIEPLLKASGFFFKERNLKNHSITQC